MEHMLQRRKRLPLLLSIVVICNSMSSYSRAFQNYAKN